MSFGSDFTDNPAGPGEGDGESIATFLLGIPDGGTITSVTPNAIYNRQIYAVYALDDFKVTPRLTLNLGLRYELFTTIKEANNNSANFDFSSLSLIVPSGQNAQLTPTLATELPIQNNGSRGLISPTPTILRPALDCLINCPTSSFSAAAMASFMAGRKTAHSPIQAPASILRSCLRRRSLLPVVRPRRILRPVSRIARSRPRTTAACRLNFLQQGFPANSLSQRPERARALLARSASGHSLHPAVAPWSGVPTCPPTPFSKFPTAVRAD
jgi:hypothetical protein